MSGLMRISARCVLKYDDVNGRGSTVNRALDGSTYPG